MPPAWRYPEPGVAYVFALISAISYGAADFVGGLTARRASTLAIVFISHGAGLLLLGVLLPLLPAAESSRADLAWGAAAGLAGSTGVALLYRALAVGTMAIVAPVTAACAVIVPVLADVAGGARLGLRVSAGIALAVLAIGLVSQAGGGPRLPGVRRGRPKGMGFALLSGVAIGLFFLVLARTGPDSGLEPLFAARLVSVVLFATVALVSRAPLTMPPRLGLMAAGAGALDMLANALYLIATRGGELSAIVTLASLYPASTVILARIVLRERLAPLQYVGIGCAMVAVVMIVWTG